MGFGKNSLRKAMTAREGRWQALGGPRVEVLTTNA